MASTVRENIIFGEAFDADRYKKVLHACALEKDLELFDAGDQTELGEKGLNARYVDVALLCTADVSMLYRELTLYDASPIVADKRRGSVLLVRSTRTPTSSFSIRSWKPLT